jgi:hypothetical protein
MALKNLEKIRELNEVEDDSEQIDALDIVNSDEDF